MLSHSWQPLRVLTAAALAVAVPQAVLAQPSQHIVSPQELTQAAHSATQARQQNIDVLQGLLGRSDVRKMLESKHIDPQQVQQAIASLNDQELAQLAARATKAENEFSAGAISNEELLILVAVILVIVLIIVAVK